MSRTGLRYLLANRVCRFNQKPLLVSKLYSFTPIRCKITKYVKLSNQTNDTTFAQCLDEIVLTLRCPNTYIDFYITNKVDCIEASNAPTMYLYNTANLDRPIDAAVLDAITEKYRNHDFKAMVEIVLDTITARLR